MFDWYNWEIKIKGKHASYMKALCGNPDESKKVFNDHIDIYLLAPIIGMINCKKAEIDTEKSEEAQISLGVITAEKNNIDFVARLVALLDGGKNKAAKEKIGLAFDEQNNDKLQEVYESYFRGGIEWLYDEFTKDATTKEQFIRRINFITQVFKAEWEL